MRSNRRSHNAWPRITCPAGCGHDFFRALCWVMTDSADSRMSPSGTPTRALGRQGLRVAAIGLGCMGMSEFYGDESQRSEANGIRVIHHALDIGIDFLDTSDMYGPFTNEQLVGKAIAGRRDQAVIATKFGLVRDPADPARRTVNGRPEYVHSACEASLKRLRVDHIDLYYQHRVDRDVPIEETVGAMSLLVQQGKVRFLGLSEAAPQTLRRACAVHPISALQSEWSLWSRDWETNSFPAARELGIGIVPYSPLGRGFLTGSITSRSQLPSGDYRLTAPRFQEGHFESNMHLVDAVRTIAADKGCTPAQLALAWVLSRGEDVVPIPGTTRIERLDENAGAMHVGLSAADLARLEQSVPRDAASGARFPAGMGSLVDRPLPG
jgi:aryl-alcohol dehydrogenase-like predicted oxidoreductase